MNIFDFIYPKRCLGCGLESEEKLLCQSCKSFFFVHLDPPGVEWAFENSPLIQQIHKNPLACEDWLYSLLLVCLSHAKFSDVEVLLANRQGPLWIPSKNVAKILGWQIEPSQPSLWSYFHPKKNSEKTHLLVELGDERGPLDLRNIPRKLYYFSLFLQKEKRAKSYL